MTDALVRLRWNEIEYDVKFDTWARGNTREKPDEKLLYRGGKMTDWLLRQVQNAVDNIAGALRWCVVDHAHITDDEILEEAIDYWEIRFRWPGHWHGSENALKGFAHQYVVQSALHAWYQMVGLPSEGYQQAAELALANLYRSARKTSVDTNFRL